MKSRFCVTWWRESECVQGSDWEVMQKTAPTIPSQLLMATDVSSMLDTCPV